MPFQDGVLNLQERRFSAEYALTTDRNSAAANAGYAHPRIAASKLLARPAVQAEIVKLQLERVTNELLPLAVNSLKYLLTNERVPAGAKVQAAKVVFDRAFGDTPEASRQPHEMTGEELARQLDYLRREAADRAKPVIEAEITQDAPNVMD